MYIGILWILLGFLGIILLTDWKSWLTINEHLCLLLLSYTGPICFILAVICRTVEYIRHRKNKFSRR